MASELKVDTISEKTSAVVETTDSDFDVSTLSAS